MDTYPNKLCLAISPFFVCKNSSGMRFIYAKQMEQNKVHTLQNFIVCLPRRTKCERIFSSNLLCYRWINIQILTEQKGFLRYDNRIFVTYNIYEQHNSIDLLTVKIAEHKKTHAVRLTNRRYNRSFSLQRFDFVCFAPYIREYYSRTSWHERILLTWSSKKWKLRK